MNKNCEKNTTAHSQNIVHVDALYNIKRKKHKNVTFNSSLSICMHVSHSLSNTRLSEQAFSSTQLHYHQQHG